MHNSEVHTLLFRLVGPYVLCETNAVGQSSKRPAGASVVCSSNEQEDTFQRRRKESGEFRRLCWIEEKQCSPVTVDSSKQGCPTPRLSAQ